MIKALSIGNTIVANIHNKMYKKEFATKEEMLEVYQILANTDEHDSETLDLIKIFKPEESEQEKQLKIEFEAKKLKAKQFEDILDFMKDVRDNGHQLFEVIENSLYLKGIKATMPDILIREMIKASGDTGEEVDVERVSALINFWSLCALNPDPRARFDLFKFLKNHNLRLTDSGNFIAYRTVNVYTSGDAELEKFVTQEWLKVKRWKKSPSNYAVFIDDEDNSYTLKVSKEMVGNLDKLYHNISQISGNVYTDAHTGTCRIKIGEPVEMDRIEVDPDPMNSCSRGYHLGNQDFMKSNMGYFGKVGIVCLVNPKDVTSVPEYDSGKMRTCRYLPIAVAELDDNGHIIDVDVDVFDLELAQNTQEELEAMSNLSSTELEEYKKHEFIAPEIDYNTVRNILNSVKMSIDEANNKIKNRVVEI